MSDGVSDAAKQDLGPMPVWVWGVMAGGAFVLYRYIQNRQASANAAPVAVSTGVSPLDAGPYNITASPGTSAASTTAAPTNSSWISQAEAGLLGSGNDPIHILQALNDYLQGNPLSYAEQGIVNQAIQSYGLPPQGGAPLGALSPAPAPPAPPTPNSIASSNGNRLVTQGDGNVVEYNAAGQPIWSSWYGKLAGVGSDPNNPTAAQPGATSGTLQSGNGITLAVQPDGNVVEYNGAGKPIWASWFGLMNGGGH
jgi:hypothetical protein